MTNGITFRYKVIVIISLFMLLFFTILINYLNLEKFQDIGIHSFVSFNNLLFLLIGMLLFAISAYLTICMFHYKVGKLFVIYTFLSGLSVSLAPCAQLHPAVDITETISALAGSLILFQTIGQLTLLNKKPLFYLFRGLLAIFTVSGIVLRLLMPAVSTPPWLALLSEECVNAGILICAVGSLIISVISNFFK